MLEAGSNLGDIYQVKRLLNQGGFGRVWLAYDTILKRDVAIKEVIEVDKSHISNFIKEMQTIACLDNHNIIKIHQA